MHELERKGRISPQDGSSGGDLIGAAIATQCSRYGVCRNSSLTYIPL